eukprot:13228118-Heterocapsa_arctica.AAC.1
MAAALPLGEPGVGVIGLDPSPIELASLDTLPKVAAWAGMTELQSAALYAALGGPARAREVAVVARGSWDSLLLPAEFGTPIVAARYEIFRRCCRLLAGLTPGDPAIVRVEPAAGPAVAQALPARTARALKLSSVVDQ